MGRCTAVDILMLEDNTPTTHGPETKLRPDQRLPLLEEVWAALTDVERENIADRLHAKTYLDIAARMPRPVRPYNADEDWGNVGTEAGS